MHDAGNALKTNSYVDSRVSACGCDNSGAAAFLAGFVI